MNLAVKATVLMFPLLAITSPTYSYAMTGVLSREQIAQNRNNDIIPHHEPRRQDHEEGIHFGVDSTWLSEPIIGVPREDLVVFLGLKSTRNIFLTAGGTKEVEEIPAVQSSPLKQLWEEGYGSLGANYRPKHDDIVVGVDSVVTYPGISLMSRIFVGVKNVMTPTGTPELNILLLSERRSAILSGPLRWFSRKESKIGNVEDQGFSPSTAKAHTRVSIVETDDGSYAFQVQSKIDVDIELPAFLMRAMPKENSEEFGNRAILKSIAQDTQTALSGAREAFLKWNNEQRLQRAMGSSQVTSLHKDC